MKNKLKELFIGELNDMLSAEEQIIKGLPDLIEAADSPDLKEAFENHLEETKEQVERLHEIFTLIKAKPEKEKCKAMKGLIDECSEVIKEYDASALRDAALITKAQRIEHYEIAAYGSLRSFAKELELDKAVDLINETIKEEGNADKKLTKIAEGSLLTSGINCKVNK